MRWIVHGERPLYQSPWVNLHLVDVEVPGGPRFDHHAIRMPAPAAGTVVVDPERGVLLLYRHRFITDSWGWEIPAGRIEAGETAAATAARETLEETGWRPGRLEALIGYNYANGLSDGRFELFLAHGATYIGEPTDPAESSLVEWTAFDVVRQRVLAGEVPDGLSLSALVWCLAFDKFPRG